MGLWDSVKGIGETAANIGTLGAYSVVKGVIDPRLGPSAATVAEQQAIRDREDAIADQLRQQASAAQGRAPDQMRGVALGPVTNATAAEMEKAQINGVANIDPARVYNTAFAAAPVISPNERAVSSRMGSAALAARTAIAGTPGARAAAIDTGLSSGARGFQLDTLRRIQRAANGEEPSVAQEQLRAATDANIARSEGNAVALSRGGNTALALRSMMRTQADANQQEASQAALLRAQEIAAARGQLGDVSAQVRGADIGLETTRAGLETDVNKFNTAQAGATAAAQANLDAQLAAANTERENRRTEAQAAQDTGVSQFNAGATNATNTAQAGMARDVALANAQAQNDIAKYDVAQRNAAALQNQQTQAALAQKQAEIDAAANQQNAAAGTQVALANAGAANTLTAKRADLSQATDAANLAARTQQRAQNDQQQVALSGAAQAADNTASGVTNTIAGQETTANSAKLAADTGIIQGVLGAISSGGKQGAASDERVKRNIADESEADVRKLFRSIKPKAFNYKDEASPGADHGRQVGVMAQDVERGGIIGRSMVENVGGIKMLKNKPGVWLALAKSLDGRLARLESRAKGGG